MPRAEDPACDDPFSGLVLDEEFVRQATVREPSGRRRIRAARWRRTWQVPVFALATVAVAVAVLVAGPATAGHPAPVPSTSAASVDVDSRSAHR